LFTHQRADVVTISTRPTATTRWPITVSHLQGGVTQELHGGLLRPFLTGLIGLTRYSTEGDSEFRFTAGAGGGFKVFPTSPVGLRFDSRLFATFVNVDGNVLACGPGVCFAALRVDVVWQAEFTAALIVRFR
jgi:hypothetical protein